MNKRTHFEYSGLVIIVTEAQAAAQSPDSEIDAVHASIKAVFPAATVGIWPNQIDITLPGDGTYFFRPSGELQEALEAFQQGEPILAGRYVADRWFRDGE